MTLSFKLYKLKPHFFTSSAVRFAYRFRTYWSLQNKHKKLSFHKKWTAGRNDKGVIIFRTRSSSTVKRKNTSINYHFRWKKIAILGAFQFVPFKNKLLSLIFFTNGMVHYVVTTEFQKLFAYLVWDKKKSPSRFKIRNLCRMIAQFKRLSFVSLIELHPGLGAQYCRSPGTSSRIIKFDHILHTVLLQLPSKVKKIISYYSLAFLGKVSLKLSMKCTSNKAGYWRNFGFKPVVRGVAMNPVDHPHGGRAKSIKYPRTPWGKTTKFK